MQLVEVALQVRLWPSVPTATTWYASATGEGLHDTTALSSSQEKRAATLVGGQGSGESDLSGEFVFNLQPKTKAHPLTHGDSVRRAPQTAARVRHSRHDDAVTGVTPRPVQVAAGAGDVAGQVGAVPGLGRGRVQGVSLAAFHQVPRDEDGGIVALGEGGDAGEGARRWEKDEVVLPPPQHARFRYLRMFSTCLQGDGFAGPTLAAAVCSDNAEIVEDAAHQVFHLAGGVGGSAAVGRGPLPSYG